MGDPDKIISAFMQSIIKREIIKNLTGRPTKISPNDSPDTVRSLTRENESAEILAKNGFKVEQNPVVPGAKNPDYRINGEIFDNYAPSTNNARNIWDTVLDKVSDGQTNNVVINLGDSAADINALRNQFSNYPIPGLDKILIIDKLGTIIKLK